ncbi:TetR family transcriptional regulator [Yinghuangia soli]|uniref:TetR family transcriptional regulator n=1 Tax=Yinghuangia soli TaxID=2908204 RepID=A0AA41U5T4_9ACTN|nr:TetR family transcriptional regulator [Yinghuangia soli]MCF2530294.1 TetR family transcriptional regulator [Yinghuangia soli]
MPTERESGRGRLSREIVLTTALALVDREGLDALSMRKLAGELGVEPMALYHYAENKDALLDGLVELMFDETHQALDAGPEETGVRAEMHRIALAFYRAANTHPQVLPLVVSRLLTVPLVRRPAPVLRLPERVLARLAAEGVDGPSAIRAYRACSAWALGFAIIDLRAVVDAPDETDPGFRLGLHRLRKDYPMLRSLAPVMAEGGGEPEFLAGLDALLDGLGIIDED